jgi:hypothetical protein
VLVLPEEVRVRRAVGEGIGRGLRDSYAQHKSEPIPDYIQELLARVKQAQWHSVVGAMSQTRKQFGAP